MSVYTWVVTKTAVVLAVASVVGVAAVVVVVVGLGLRLRSFGVAACGLRKVPIFPCNFLQTWINPRDPKL